MKTFLLFLFFICTIAPLFAQSTKRNLDKEIDEIMKARDEMLRSLLDDSNIQNFDQHFKNLFNNFDKDDLDNSFFGMGMGTPVGEYDWRETETQKILSLKVKQLKDKPLDIKIEKGLIKLKGDVESSFVDEAGKNKRVSKVHFERMFSIPEGVDQNNPDFENKDGELLIKFKKINKSIKKIPEVQAPSENKAQPIEKEAGDTLI